MSKLIALKPKVSEKSYGLSESGNVYTFEIPKSANKHDVARAITEQYEVTALRVRIASVPGKTKRSYRRGGKNIFKGTRSDVRKAYVTLAEGDKLPIFSAIEDSGKPDKESK